MPERVSPEDRLSPVKRALVQLQRMRDRVEAAERSRVEPIAIVGIGCRFPGGGRRPKRPTGCSTVKQRMLFGAGEPEPG